MLGNQLWSCNFAWHLISHINVSFGEKFLVCHVPSFLVLEMAQHNSIDICLPVSVGDKNPRDVTLEHEENKHMSCIVDIL